MSRGKYAAKATKRRSDLEAVATIETYQRTVKRLTQEKSELQQALTSERDGWNAERRALRAEIAEGTAPQVRALEHELERLRKSQDQLMRQHAQLKKSHDSTVSQLARMTMAQTGCTPLEALELLISAAEESKTQITVFDMDPSQFANPSLAIQRIERARGKRSAGSA